MGRSRARRCFRRAGVDSPKGTVADIFFAEVVSEARRRNPSLDEHFSVDGTLVEAWAGTKSFRRRNTETGLAEKPCKSTVDSPGEKQRNEAHASTTDREARLRWKSGGSEATLIYHGHGLMENLHGLAVGSRVTTAGGIHERESALALFKAGARGPSAPLWVRIAATTPGKVLTTSGTSTALTMSPRTTLGVAVH